MLLSDLPNDIIIIVLHSLPVPDLGALSRTSKSFYQLVNTFGWQIHIRCNPRPSFSLAQAREVWKPRRRLQYDTLSDKSWTSFHFVARPLSHPWSRKQQPMLAINNKRLVVAAGNTIYAYAFGTPRASGSPPLRFEGSCSLHNERNSQWDITALTFVPDNGEGRTLLCGFHNGTLARVVIFREDNSRTLTPKITIEASLQSHAPDIVESVSASGSLQLSLSSRGHACMVNLQETPYTATSEIDLAARSWTTYMSDGGSPYVAFGSSSKTAPLSVHSILEGSLSHTPTAILGTKSSQSTSYSAVYGICRSPFSSPWGASPQILISGWFDGVVRVHDLRSYALAKTSPSNSNSNSPAPLRPVMSLNDPWSIEPIYSVSSGGGACSHLAAGSARHSVVSFWDIRYPKSGWSVYAPGNDPSPVYSVLLESSRVFGATDSRPFVYDFGPDVTQDTYPQLSPSPGLKPRRSVPGYYVTRYSHGYGSLLNDH
ncbi:MAG: hypothetical protein NXY57DRAFT_108808 [Lentinula lateritia]|uniref:F-box domain-containing protein n=1 Tax=Lentinula lateritia TaxID=40482 RepID=A0ABQ8V495_9AGAR|nr:MAG: hypothetical protein NXY57DRAFT_108808 [Lentinula lateritia]KAJ4472403.1 hypothetical protein C8R41DRAFT_870486 [Lentinula lateritia]